MTQLNYTFGGGDHRHGHYNLQHPRYDVLGQRKNIHILRADDEHTSLHLDVDFVPYRDPCRRGLSTDPAMMGGIIGGAIGGLIVIGLLAFFLLRVRARRRAFSERGISNDDYMPHFPSILPDSPHCSARWSPRSRARACPGPELPDTDGRIRIRRARADAAPTLARAEHGVCKRDAERALPEHDLDLVRAQQRIAD
ncbi:hypothetical protein ONZ51_g12904 [Trametes cubensis]|uniref:Uncharacterized protein n=1 Tax=Trametes cubensis TaxID=1111947 RepID=A0AAD7TF91_9APHY|nr:hypothetical protein ONZ51_g12904 [Trametes cubensis]